MKNVFLTGITGFIGPILAKKFIEKGYNVYGLVRHSPYRDLESLSPLLDKIHLIEGDVRDYHTVASAIRSSLPEVVIHLAALTPVRLSFVDPFQFIRVNFEGTANVVHATVESAPEARLIHASTGEVYGWLPKDIPVKESAPLHPACPYGVAKMAADHYVQMAMKLYGLRATVLRFFNTYGRREKGFFVEYVISTMLKGDTVYVGLPHAVRDYMWIDDHIKSYMLSIQKKSAIGQVFNVSPGNPISNIDLAKKIAKITGFTGEIVEGEYPSGYPTRPATMDPTYIVGDNTKIREVLGWKPSVSLDEGLKKAVNIFIKAE
jgi:nucleoside-diphosphate-sugar epimerase